MTDAPTYDQLASQVKDLRAKLATSEMGYRKAVQDLYYARSEIEALKKKAAKKLDPNAKDSFSRPYR